MPPAFNIKYKLTAVLISGAAGLALSSQAYAATYYISPAVSGNGNCMSYANSCLWATACAKPDATEIVVKGGTYRITSTWKIEKTGLIIKAATGEAPVLDLNWEYPRANGYPDDMPACFYLDAITISAPDVVVDGIRIIKSRGRGINMNSTGGVARNVDISYCYNMGVQLGPSQAEGNNLLENSRIIWNNHARDLGIYNKWENITNNVTIHGNNNTVRGCTVAYAPTGGIEGYVDIGTTIENNIIYGNRLSQIHEARSKNCTIRNNLIYGIERPNVSAYEGWGVGIELACELWYDGANWDYGHKIYNNMIANTSNGISLNYAVGINSNYPNNTIRQCTIVGNTVIEPNHKNTEAIFNHALFVNDSHVGAGNIIKNNVFWQTNGNISYGNITGGKVEFGNNFWSKAPAISYQSSSDSAYPAYGAQTMSLYFSKSNGWNSLSAGSIFANDFKLLPTASLAINKGAVMGVEYNRDYWNTLRPQGGAWDIGANEYAAGSNPADITPPPAPSGLAVF